MRVPKLNVSCSIFTLCMKNFILNSLSGTSLKFPYGHPLQILQFSIMDISNCTSETKVITPSMSTHSPSIFGLSLFLPSKTIYPDLSELIIISTSAYPSLREKKKVAWLSHCIVIYVNRGNFCRIGSCSILSRSNISDPLLVSSTWLKTSALALLLDSASFEHFLLRTLSNSQLCLFPQNLNQWAFFQNRFETV